jgi:3-oxoacyl-[acyl-carrier protein] reductase
MDDQRSYIESIYSLAGKNCIVTGAGSGLGQQCAKTFAKAGANVALVDMNESGLSETAGEISEYGVTVLKQLIDLRKRSEIESGIAKIAETFQTFDVVVNCAGILVLKTIFEQTEEDWDSVLDTNLKGMWMFSKATAAQMIRTNVKGSIINISSATSSRPMANLLPYGASKAGVNHMTRSFAQGVVSNGIRVNAIVPGAMLTQMQKEFGKTEEGKKTVAEIPMKRAAALDELDGCLLFVASNNASSYMTGAIIEMDGGWATIK